MVKNYIEYGARAYKENVALAKELSEEFGFPHEVSSSFAYWGRVGNFTTIRDDTRMITKITQRKEGLLARISTKPVLEIVDEARPENGGVTGSKRVTILDPRYIMVVPKVV